MFFNKIILSAFAFSLSAYATQATDHQQPLLVHTAYGDFQVAEPVLIDLFASPAVERLKKIRQYGTQDYVKEESNYSRHEHSVGVWALLRHYGASLEEQIAGLLHDASHTVFSHVGDFLFGDYKAKDSYQDDIHEECLRHHQIDKVLEPYNLTLQDILHKNGDFKRLEQNLPDMCIDRIEYNLKAGVLIGSLKEDEIKDFVADLCFDTPTSRWYFNTASFARRFAEIPLYNTQHVWGGPEVYAINTLTSDILKRAMECNLLTCDEIHYSTDDIVWKKLCNCTDENIQEKMATLKNYKNSFVYTTKDQADHVVTTKFRGFNPWVKTEIGFVRLTDLDPEFHKIYNETKDLVKRGWPIKWVEASKEKETTNTPCFFIEGPTGIGKTTFLELISKHLPDATVVYEPIETFTDVNGKGNILDCFYSDPKRWSFTVSTYITLKHIEAAEQQKKSTTSIMLADHSIYCNCYVFGKMAYRLGNTNALEWEVYQQLVSWFISKSTIKPCGFIYLQANPETALDRVRTRNRTGEDGAMLAYEQNLDRCYREWFVEKKDIPNDLAQIPVLIIDATQNFKDDPVIQKDCVNQVKAFIEKYKN